MTTDAIASPSSTAVPNLRTLRNLFIGGYCALMAWEIWARTITAWVVGGPLEPPERIRTLVDYWMHVDLPLPTATFLHYMVGIFGYPIAYYVVSRALRRWGPLLDIGVLAIFTAYLAWRFTHAGFELGAAIFWVIVALDDRDALDQSLPIASRRLELGLVHLVQRAGNHLAPLAGLPFLLLDGGLLLSFMSWVGHVIFGYLAVLIFERLEAKA